MRRVSIGCAVREGAVRAHRRRAEWQSEVADSGTGRGARRGATRVLAGVKRRRGAHQLESDSKQGQSTQPNEHILRFATREGVRGQDSAAARDAWTC